MNIAVNFLSLMQSLRHDFSLIVVLGLEHNVPLSGVAVCRVHDLRSMAQVAFLEAHDAEVLCLEFTRPASGNVYCSWF